MQQIEHHGAAGLEEEIINACVSCLSFDPQVEAPRAPWLFSIVDRADLNIELVRAIEATTLELIPENHRDLDQRCAILKELAAAGLEEARLLLYASLVRLSGTSDVIGAVQIVELDGENGLIFVARQLGRWLREDPGFWVDDYVIGQLDEATGIAQGLAALEREAAVDADIANYLAGVDRTRESVSRASNRSDATAYTGAEIVEHAGRNPKDQCHWFRRWAAQASQDQREIVFAALLESVEPEQAKRLFRCFAKTGVLRFDECLLPWVVHEDRQVKWAAVTAMASVTHPAVRAAGKRLIAEGDLAEGIALLVCNFEAGDFSIVTGHLEQLDDADEVHHVAGELLDLCEAHPGPEALDALLEIYTFSPCSTCRRKAANMLISANLAPLWLLEECVFDADPETRSLVG
jgi:hypothetical protein